MRMLKRNRWLAGLTLALAFLALAGGRAAADVRTDQPGSINVFPKVIADGTRDTLIQITNASNSVRYAHCVYNSGGAVCSTTADRQCAVDADCPTNELCEPFFMEHDFLITLTRQQPTIWRVATGRRIDPSSPADGECEGTCSGTPDPCVDHSDCSPGQLCRLSCPGIDPSCSVAQDGQCIPPVVPPFRGELKCIEVDESEAPESGNWLKGEAVIKTLGGPQTSVYNSINIQGVPDGNDGNLVLELDNSEYNACPQTLEFTHYRDGAENMIARDLGGATACGTNPTQCPVRTEITIVPCTELFEAQVCPPVTVGFDVYDQLESFISGGADFRCWYNQDTSNIGAPGLFTARQTNFLSTHIESKDEPFCLRGNQEMVGEPCASDAACGAGGICGAGSGVLAVVEEIHESAGTGAELFGTAAVDLHSRGVRTGICRVGAGPCASDADCADGICRDAGGQACSVSSECATGIPCDRCLIDEITLVELPQP